MSSLEALWTMEFGVAGWVNGGVVVLESGRLFGGDSSYYYLGTYELTGNRVHAQARITHYSGSIFTAFGDNARDFGVQLTGVRQDDTIQGHLVRTDTPRSPALPVRMLRRAPLP